MSGALLTAPRPHCSCHDHQGAAYRDADRLQRDISASDQRETVDHGGPAQHQQPIDQNPHEAIDRDLIIAPQGAASVQYAPETHDDSAINHGASGHCGQLRTAFIDARVQAASTAKYTTASCPPKTCRYCGKHWTSPATGKLDGHSLCAVTPAFVRRICLLWWSTPDLTRLEIANHLGLSRSIIQAWTSDPQMQRAGIR